MIKLALRVAFNLSPCHFEPELVRAIIRMDDLGAADIDESPCPLGYTINIDHSIARQTGTSQRSMQLSDNIQEVRLTSDCYRVLFRETLCLGADIHSIVDGMTPFLAFLQRYFAKTRLSRFQNGNMPVTLLFRSG